MKKMFRDPWTWFFIAVLVVGVIYCTIPAWAQKVTYQAPPDFVKVNMVAVEATMTALGYRVDGYSALQAPTVLFVDRIDTGDWGSTGFVRDCPTPTTCQPVRTTIYLSERMPTACLLLTLAHEMGHDASVRMGVIDDVPNQEVKARLEAISANVEDHFGTFEYRPNCFPPGRLRR